MGQPESAAHISPTCLHKILVYRHKFSTCMDNSPTWFHNWRLVKTSPGLVKTTLGLVKSKPGLVKAFGREITTAPLSHRTNCASQRHFFCREQATSVLLPCRKTTVHLSVKTHYLIPICHEENAHPTLARPAQPPLGTLQHQRHP